MNHLGKTLEQLRAIGVGSVVVACCYLLSLGKAQVLVCAAIGSIVSVLFYRRQLGRPFPVHRGAVLGGAVGIVGTLSAFSVLGVAGALGWRPARNLAELSQIYEGRGLSESEISVIYNVFVGESTFNDVTISIFLVAGLVGLVGGGLMALLLGGWKVRGPSLSETLYDWKIVYRPGEKVPLPPLAKLGFRMSTVAFVLLLLSMLTFYVSQGTYKIQPNIYSLVINILVGFQGMYYSGIAAFLGYTITIFLFPWGGHYRPARLRAAAMAILTIVLVVGFSSLYF